METQEQSERETCHVIVFSRDGTDVLLKWTPAGLIFPSVQIPRWGRWAEDLNAALRRDWGCEAICLFTLNHPAQDSDQNGDHYEAMECWHNQHFDKANWKPIRSLTADTFQNEVEFRILEQCLHELDGYEHDPSLPFARRGWLSELKCWTAEILRSKGFELTGRFCQYNASSAFNLIRLETTGPAVWFKAVGEPNLREFPITLNLAERFPRFIPKILGTKPEWNGWLSEEIDGANLGEVKDIAMWERAATELARLQIESISESQSILQSGAHDLTAKPLLSAVDPFFDLVARLMKEQPKVPPAILSRDELSLLKLRIEDALTLLEDMRIPDSLGHLDLNPWNVIASTNGCVFVDWAEAYVGSPFFSLEYLLEHFHRAIGADTAFESQLVQAYRAAWTRLLSDEVISDGLALAPMLAVFAYAIRIDAWKDEERLRDPKIAGYFRSLARRVNREAIRFIERGSPCLS